MIVMVDNDEINRKRIWIFFSFSVFLHDGGNKKRLLKVVFFRDTVPPLRKTKMGNTAKAFFK